MGQSPKLMLGTFLRAKKNFKGVYDAPPLPLVNGDLIIALVVTPLPLTERARCSLQALQIPNYGAPFEYECGKSKE